MEWMFCRRLILRCPTGNHVIGAVRDDTAGTYVSGQVAFSGPPEEPQRTLRWTCASCDLASAKTGNLARSGKPRRHEGKISAAGFAELLEQMTARGPERADVQLDPASIATLTARVVSGEQLLAVQTSEQARIRRHRGSPQPTWQWDDFGDTIADDATRPG